jgi:hypothetical protein
MRYALLLLSGAPVLAAAYSTKSYNLTLDDFSPLLMYDPPVGNLWPDVDKYEMSDTAWNCSFTASSWRTWSPWMVGGGKSYHWGQERGTMKVTWEGTGITVMGQSSQWYYGNATLEVGDNKGACTYGGTQGEMITCVLSGLPTGLHTATFTITKGQLTVGEVQLVADFMTDL